MSVGAMTAAYPMAEAGTSAAEACPPRLPHPTVAWWWDLWLGRLPVDTIPDRAAQLEEDLQAARPSDLLELSTREIHPWEGIPMPD